MFKVEGLLSVLLCSDHLEKQHSEMREEVAHTKSSVRIMKVSCLSKVL